MMVSPSFLVTLECTGEVSCRVFLNLTGWEKKREGGTGEASQSCGGRPVVGFESQRICRAMSCHTDGPVMMTKGPRWDQLGGCQEPQRADLFPGETASLSRDRLAWPSWLRWGQSAQSRLASPRCKVHAVRAKGGAAEVRDSGSQAVGRGLTASQGLRRRTLQGCLSEWG